MAEQKIFSALNLNGNSIIGGGFEVVFILPSDGNFVGRQVYYNGKYYFFNGAVWVAFASEGYVGEGVLTIKQGGATKGIFSANEKTNKTITLDPVVPLNQGIKFIDADNAQGFYDASVSDYIITNTDGDFIAQLIANKLSIISSNPNVNLSLSLVSSDKVKDLFVRLDDKTIRTFLQSFKVADTTQYRYFVENDYQSILGSGNFRLIVKLCPNPSTGETSVILEAYREV